MSVKKQYKPTVLNLPIPIEIGKMPPQCIQFEETVLGILMLNPDAIYTTIQYLIAESFYKDANQKIYSAMLSLFSKSIKIDMLTVQDELKKQQWLDDVGGPCYVSSLTNYSFQYDMNLEVYCIAIKENYNKREYIRIFSEGQSMAYSEDVEPDQILNFFNTEIIRITGNNNTGAVKLNESVKQSILKIEKLSTGKIKLSGVPCGLTKVDRVTGGWQNGDLIILAGRPSMGKTAVALKYAECSGVPTAFFSLEMSTEQLTNRLISGKSGFTNMELRQGKIHDWKKLEHAVTKLENIPVYIDDTPALPIGKLMAKAYLYKQKHKIGLIIVDYLQLCTGNEQTKGNREQEISLISRSLKNIAKELDVPVIALSQMNRSIESRGANRRPQLSDLRESGSIEQDADIVIFVNCPEKYGVLNYEDGMSTHNVTELICAKHRNGSLADILIFNNDSHTNYFDYEFEGKLTDAEHVNINQNIEPNKTFDEVF